MTEDRLLSDLTEDEKAMVVDLAGQLARVISACIQSTGMPYERGVPLVLRTAATILATQVFASRPLIPDWEATLADLTTRARSQLLFAIEREQEDEAREATLQ